MTAQSNGTWLECYKKEKQEPWLKSLTGLADNGKFSKKKLALLLEATKLFDEIYTEPDHPVLIHADLNIMNIMADPETFEFTGFIDPCGSMWADREYDLFQLRNMWATATVFMRSIRGKTPFQIMPTSKLPTTPHFTRPPADFRADSLCPFGKSFAI